MILDILVVLLVLVLALRGFRRGLVREVFSFAGWILGAIAAVRFVFLFTPWVMQVFTLPASVAGLISFVGIFLVVSFVVWLLGYLLSMVIRLTLVLRPLDKAGGLAVGGLEGVVLAAILVGVFGASPLFPGLSDQIEKSTIASRISDEAAVFFSALRDRAQGGRTAPEEESPDGPASGPEPGAPATPRGEPSPG